MFMIVSYPWPVASAHVQLAGTSRKARGTRETTRTAAASRSHIRPDQDQAVTEPGKERRILISPKV
jgi:hypothetical protein